MQTSADIINSESINMECYMNQVERDLLAKKNKNLNSCSIVFKGGKYIVVEETDFWRKGIMKNCQSYSLFLSLH